LSSIALQIILISYGTSIEFVADAKFQQLHVAAEVKRAAPNEDKARLVRKVEKLVLEFRRPVRQEGEGIFSAVKVRPRLIRLFSITTRSPA
jgi:hypothetical protein